MHFCVATATNSLIMTIAIVILENKIAVLIQNVFLCHNRWLKINRHACCNSSCYFILNRSDLNFFSVHIHCNATQQNAANTSIFMHWPCISWLFCIIGSIFTDLYDTKRWYCTVSLFILNFLCGNCVHRHCKNNDFRL